MKPNSASVTVPDTEFRISPQATVFYVEAQNLLSKAIEEQGLAMGVSVVTSGLTRELRRHLDPAGVASLLRGLADTMDQVQRFDEPDCAGG